MQAHVDNIKCIHIRPFFTEYLKTLQSSQSATREGATVAPGADHVLSEHLSACFEDGETRRRSVWLARACPALII
jgi:hypothetical protein